MIFTNSHILTLSAGVFVGNFIIGGLIIDRSVGMAMGRGCLAGVICIILGYGCKLVEIIDLFR